MPIARKPEPSSVDELISELGLTNDRDPAIAVMEALRGQPYSLAILLKKAHRNQ